MRTSNILLITTMTALAACTNIPNAREADVMVNGNCEQCKETIEKAALTEGVSKADWDPETRHATIIYDSTKTSLNAVLQRIANAGYDSQAFVASDSAYNDLPECCQYERTGKTVNPPESGDTRHGH